MGKMKEQGRRRGRRRKRGKVMVAFLVDKKSFLLGLIYHFKSYSEPSSEAGVLVPPPSNALNARNPSIYFIIFWGFYYTIS